MNKDIHSVYIAGPMSGIENWNFDAFCDAAEVLRREHGFVVYNPAEMDHPAEINRTDPFDRNHVGNPDWCKYLKRDIHVIISLVDAVVVIQGWQYSRGASLEVHIAFELGMPVLAYPELELVTEGERMESLSKVMSRAIQLV